MGHRVDVDEFYQQLRRLERRVGGARRLGDCTGRHPWPRRGVYFIFEVGELRHDATNPRVVRVGTHALKPGSQTSLWQRLARHRGTRPHSQPGGNHRGSVFRHHVGLALLNRGLHPEAAASWALPHPTPRGSRPRGRLGGHRQHDDRGDARAVGGRR